MIKKKIKLFISLVNSKRDACLDNFTFPNFVNLIKVFHLKSLIHLRDPYINFHNFVCFLHNYSLNPK